MSAIESAEVLVTSPGRNVDHVRSARARAAGPTRLTVHDR